MKRLISVILVISVILALSVTAFAAGDAKSVLTAGGTIILQDDLTITEAIEIKKNTVLDMNGHTITGKAFQVPFVNGDGKTIYNNDCYEISVAEGVSFSVKNGTINAARIDNYGTIDYIKNMKLNAGDANCAVYNYGVIKSIRYCTVRGNNQGIGNNGDIDLIDNCDIETKSTTAVSNNMYVSKTDKDGKNTIAKINHCRIVCTDTRHGTGFAGGEPANGATVITDSVIIGYGRGGIHVYGQSPVSIYDSVVICTSTAEEKGAQHPAAIWDAMYADYPTYTAPHVENSTLIALDGPCGYYDYNIVEVSHNGQKSTVYDWFYVEYSDLVNCNYVKLSGSNWQKYTAWTMDEEPVAPAGLSNFKEVKSYTTGQFKDVKAKNWFNDNVAKAYELGLMKGDSDTSFNPNGNVTLAEAITMAARLHSIYSTGTEDFVQGKVWYQTYVDYAKANGIISGDFANYNAPATRTQFAAIFAASMPKEALAAKNTIADNAIPDVKITDTSAASIYALYRAGVLTGSDGGAFKPASSISRAEAAAIVTRMADDSLRKDVTL